MHALDSEAANTIRVAIEALLPNKKDVHPLGCHRYGSTDRQSQAAMSAPTNYVPIGNWAAPQSL
ncbi:hypothetical protein [Acidithrix ferrooxidans]|uniref:Uncharacterized protein n=1 Tax=Acidithrix ferrooxidans TaxID=1280514 RepID=A0A0D8HDK9_9ACTN|nr:hypothetical protein [Acidithrix ferrooxidans]KJF16045.1 hypothetical protein AXFE_31190 [Acidithrix ferrooxidans]